ncbi:MAG: OB-fold domain-containing protein [Pseudomonadales bacterium]|nr:OB-fold domain-containing protein [Pseudomonadales bacterium]
MSRYMPDGWALPAIDNKNRDFFTSGKIVVQACKDCDTVQHPPEDICHVCQGSALESRFCSGEGTVYSHIVVEHPIPGSLKDRVPYAVILVSLTDHPQIRILGNPVNIEARDVAVGQKVRAVFESLEDKEAGLELKIPQWEVIQT